MRNNSGISLKIKQFVISKKGVITKMNNPYHDTNMPIGLAMELSQNINAMNVFASMSRDEQNKFISKAKQAKNKNDIKKIVDAVIHTEIE